MNTTIKTIIAIALALTLVCALGASAFADFLSPFGYVTVNSDGSRTLYMSDGTAITQYPDGTIVSVDPNTGNVTYSDKESATTIYQDGSYSYDNGNGYSEYHDGNFSSSNYANGSYDIEENGTIYHYDCNGNLIGVQVFNGSYYETVF